MFVTCCMLLVREREGGEEKKEKNLSVASRSEGAPSDYEQRQQW